MILTIAILAMTTISLFLLWKVAREERLMSQRDVDDLSKENKKLSKQLRELGAKFPDKCSRCHRYVKKGTTTKHNGKYLCQWCYKKERGADATTKRD